MNDSRSLSILFYRAAQAIFWRIVIPLSLSVTPLRISKVVSRCTKISSCSLSAHKSDRLLVLMNRFRPGFSYTLCTAGFPTDLVDILQIVFLHVSLDPLVDPFDQARSFIDQTCVD